MRPVRSMIRAVAATLGLALGVAACGPPPDPMADRFAEAARDGRAVRDTIDGRPVALLAEECRVYDLTAPPDDEGAREPVLTPDPYPWFSSCTRQRVAREGAHVVVTLGRTAFGAGGCCAAGGTYRTRDGRAWERQTDGGGWAPVSEPQPPPPADTSAAADSAADSTVP
ncbi:hypothetical protein [Roseisolibacter sp. H3M3-2]|uniref:hypothetical protein n=1 Tax=Roseisolibacter sp. H3M3-2 TaxID=3031323 RepID=UPI0023D9FA5C|nr:hypothetical protein [Roseisolibacter sp. H3M3-2]MDF1506051.1 hypothetical protein [Roseisolibacter sp. H3M3-2]